jgi:hypothetical protein
LPLLHAVELVLHAGGELDVHDVGERLDEQVRHEETELGRLEPPLLVLDHVLLVEDRPHDAGVRRRAADVVLSSSLMSVACVKRGGGCVKCCSGRSSWSFTTSPSTSGGSWPSLSSSSLPARLRVVAALGVDADEAVELEDLAGRAEAAGGHLDVDGGRVVDGRRHLARDEAVPDERVEDELVALEERRDAIGRPLHGRRPDRLVRVLRVLLRAVHVRLLGDVVLAEAVADEVARGGDRVARDARRVGAHVGDEADGALVAELHPSYRRCAMRMVRVGWKPSFRDASC